MSPDDTRHGTNAGGRVHRVDGEKVCGPCRLAESRYQNQRILDAMAGRSRKVSAVGTRRRIQALVALGHSMTELAGRLDVTVQSVWNLAYRENTHTRTATAQRVESLYAELSMRLPDQSTLERRKAATYARTVARKRGWPPPLAWDDIDIDDSPNIMCAERKIPITDSEDILREKADGTTFKIDAVIESIGDGEVIPKCVDLVVVERVLSGVRTPANTAERREIVRRWASSGRSVNELARLTGWKPERYYDVQEQAS